MQRKAAKCSVCQKLFMPFNSLSPVCGMECRIRKGKVDAAQKDLKRKESELCKTARAANANVRTVMLRAQDEFNKFIKVRDREHGCISCDKPHDAHCVWNAGHFHTVGARPDLRFDEDNCHKQCFDCNQWLSARIAVYRINLEKKIGVAAVEALDFHGPAKRYRADDYEQIAAEYRAKTKLIMQEAANDWSN